MSKQSKQKARRHKSKPSYHVGVSGSWAGYTLRKPAPSTPLHPPTKPLSQSVRAALETAIRQNLDLGMLGLDARSPVANLGVGLFLKDERVGTINPGTSRVGRHLATGDFLSENAPWGRVYDYLAEAVETHPRVDAAPGIDNATMVIRFPSGTGADVLSAATTASETIRNRFREYPVPLRLEAPQYTVTFWPAEEISGILCVPFAFKCAGRPEFVGRLCPRHPADVVPMQTSPAVGDDALRTAWLVAVSDLAKLLSEADESRTNTRPGSGPVAVSNAHVPGHKRRLPRGQHGRDEARRLAAFLGVMLAENETWVRPYARGNPIDGTVSLKWKPSIDLDAHEPETRRAA